MSAIYGNVLLRNGHIKMSIEHRKVKEVLRRSDQGAQEPFICRCDDGDLYYLKGMQTDRLSLSNELICASLARHLGLPVPHFCLAEVEEDLFDELPPKFKSIGIGFAFGSRDWGDSAWFNSAFTQEVPEQMRLKILAFDWWIRNLDRTVGNPNLLWDIETKEVVVIDHNLAFDEVFTKAQFLADHIFRDDWSKIDIVLQAQLQDDFCEAFDAVFNETCNNIPPEWSWSNAEQDLPSNMNLEATRRILESCKGQNFWSAP